MIEHFRGTVQTCAPRVFSAIASAAIAAAAVSASAPVSASPLSDLQGRWSGWGSVQMSNGTREQVKCVATYFLKDGGSSVSQNLRCASSSYKIDAAANYVLKGDQVSGRWEERTWSAVGSVSGRMTDKGFNLAIQGQTFSAGMAMMTTSCKQSIQITPQGFGVSRISIGLGKC